MSKASNRKYCMTFRAGGREHHMEYSSRSLLIMGNHPHLCRGGEFSMAVGLHENYTVLNGMDTQAWCRKSVAAVRKAAARFLKEVERELELLSYDYLYSFPDQPQANGKVPTQGGGMSIAIDGHWGLLSAKHPGSLAILFHEQNEAGYCELSEIIDLRPLKSIQTDTQGLLKVHRRKNPCEWPEHLHALLAFLAGVEPSKVDIRHHYAGQP